MKRFQLFFEDGLSIHRNRELNPLLWDGDVLKPQVRTALLNFSEAWRSFCKIPSEKVIDSLMVGGNAGYFYNDASDIDVHLLVDVQSLGFGPVVESYLRDRKVVWLGKYDVRVKGYPVEPYVQDSAEPYVAGQGIYSLEGNHWVQRPTESEYDPSQDKNLHAKVDAWGRAIDNCLAGDDDCAGVLKKKLSSMRGEGISREGELSQENLIFKELRLAGHLDKLRNYLKTRNSRDLSLD